MCEATISTPSIESDNIATTSQTNVTEEATKVCSHCKQELPLSSFSHNKKSSDKLQYWCKSCIRASQAKFKASKKAASSPLASYDSIKGDPASPLYGFTPRELMEELQARGFHGSLEYVHTIIL